MLVMLATGRDKHVAVAYGEWLEDRVLAGLKEEEPELYADVLADVKARINALVCHLRESDSTDELFDDN
ncbi:hypothetical protein CYR75_04405 [Paracoccus jeotgali]|uniref:Uncharacterized protein n=2 Tax=Paracoccus jeotgali TaxID=2065379 RepID=A0A2K9MDA9_9RHOB|nr:hypothetical protein CYR75_04405 [Paracoccus jeotgali]